MRNQAQGIDQPAFESGHIIHTSNPDLGFNQPPPALCRFPASLIQDKFVLVMTILDVWEKTANLADGRQSWTDRNKFRVHWRKLTVQFALDQNRLIAKLGKNKHL